MVFRKYKGLALNEKDVSHPPPSISEYKANVVFNLEVWCGHSWSCQTWRTDWVIAIFAMANGLQQLRHWSVHCPSETLFAVIWKDSLRSFCLDYYKSGCCVSWIMWTHLWTARSWGVCLLLCSAWKELLVFVVIILWLLSSAWVATLNELTRKICQLLKTSFKSSAEGASWFGS